MRPLTQTFELNVGKTIGLSATVRSRQMSEVLGIIDAFVRSLRCAWLEVELNWPIEPTIKLLDH